MQRLEPEEIENQTFPVSRRGYDREKVDAFLQVVAAYYREAIRQAELRARVQPVQAGEPVPPVQSAQPTQPPASHPFDQLGEQISAILSTAARSAEELTLNADRDVQRMKQAAATEAAEITQAATNQLALARQVKANVQQEAESLLTKARDEATRLKQDAHTVSARLEHNARERAARVEEAARSKVAVIMAEARRRHEQLQAVSGQTAAHIETVETALRRAREKLVGARLDIDIDDVPVEEVAGNGEAAPDGPERPDRAGYTGPERPHRAGDTAPPPAALTEPPPPPPTEPPAAAATNGAPTADAVDTTAQELIADVLDGEGPTRRRKPAATARKSRPSGGTAATKATAKANPRAQKQDKADT